VGLPKERGESVKKPRKTHHPLGGRAGGREGEPTYTLVLCWMTTTLQVILPPTFGGEAWFGFLDIDRGGNRENLSPIPFRGI